MGDQHPSKKNGTRVPLSPCHLRIQQRGGCPQARKRVLAETRITQHLDMDYGLQNCEKKQLLLTPPSLWFSLWQLEPKIVCPHFPILEIIKFNHTSNTYVISHCTLKFKYDSERKFPLNSPSLHHPNFLPVGNYISQFDDIPFQIISVGMYTHTHKHKHIFSQWCNSCVCVF